MKLKYLLIIALSGLLAACSQNRQANTTGITPKDFQNKAHQLVYNMVQKVGNYQTLQNKKDVVYTYTYTTPDKAVDISTEHYIFDGELSKGIYKKHDRTLPDLAGTITQGYDGKTFWLEHKGKYLKDEKLLKRVIFNRKTNFYWFAMFQKLLDPGLKYEYINEATIDNNVYDIVKVTFTSPDNKPTDIYQVYINRKTLLVDQFLFTVVDFNMVETPLLMQMKYTTVDGIFIPTERQYKKSTWEAAVNDEPWIKVTWTDIKFNNGLKRADFTNPQN